MKSILLASASVIGLAGAAAAEVTFSGSAALGYNDSTSVNDPLVGSSGFYWDASIDVTMSQTLDNGLTVSAEFGLNVVDGSLGDPVSTSDYVLSLTTDNAGLYFGDIDGALDEHYDLNGAFDAQDDVEFGHLGDPAAIRGDYTFGDVTVSASYGIDADDELIGLQVAANATFGNFDVRLGFADDDHFGGVDSMMMFGATTTVGGADVGFDYLTVDDVNGWQVFASYPAGAVTVGGYFAQFDLAGDNLEMFGLDLSYEDGGASVTVSYDSEKFLGVTVDSWAIEGSYDMGNGIAINAGLIDSGDAMYLGGTYDLGGDATLLVSYADDGDATVEGADIGDPEYMEGMTVEVSFEF